MTESNTATTHRIRSQLAERWPTLFDAAKPVPLAIGIHEALLAAMPEVTAGQLWRILNYWCNRPRYLAALAAGGDRHGLEGVQGAVTEAQAAKAAAVRKAARARSREKDNAKRQEELARQAAAMREAEQAKAMEEAETQWKAEEAKVQEEAEAQRKAEEAKAQEEAEAKIKAEEAKTQKAKQPEPPPAKPKPAGPVIIIKKRRAAQPGTD